MVFTLITTSAYAQSTFEPISNDTTQAAPGTQAPSVPPASDGNREDGFFSESTPYLDYGDFNSSEEEDADTLYFQYGRFFGFSLGLGYQNATGNRGLLYEPSFPRFDIKVHYWFDFQFAMEMGIFFASHSFLDTANSSGTAKTVKLVGYGVDLKYYFDVRDASAVLSFSNPFLVFGAGAMSKSESSLTNAEPDTDSSFTVGIGAGLEFPISHKKTYFILQGKYNTQSFRDTDEAQGNRTEDLSGGFMSIMGHLMFTW